MLHCSQRHIFICNQHCRPVNFIDYAMICSLLCVCCLQLVCLHQLSQSFKHLGYLLAVVGHPVAKVEALYMQVLEDPRLPGPGRRPTPNAPIYHQL